ncbi:MAG: hypothetical protein LUG55_03715 [Clostridiales bacterium]|nr:hypothetical protein [Clostridiales bacterium]
MLQQEDDNNQKHQLLVDCGAKFEHNGVTAASAVRDLLDASGKAALVTHFDEDHYRWERDSRE